MNPRPRRPAPISDRVTGSGTPAAATITFACEYNVVPRKTAKVVEGKLPVRIVGADSAPEYICGPTNEKPPPEAGLQVDTKQISNIPCTALLVKWMKVGVMATGEPFRR